MSINFALKQSNPTRASVLRPSSLRSPFLCPPSLSPASRTCGGIVKVRPPAFPSGFSCVSCAVAEGWSCGASVRAALACGRGRLARGRRGPGDPGGGDVSATDEPAGRPTHRRGAGTAFLPCTARNFRSISSLSLSSLFVKRRSSVAGRFAMTRGREFDRVLFRGSVGNKDIHFFLNLKQLLRNTLSFF